MWWRKGMSWSFYSMFKDQVEFDWLILIFFVSHIQRSLLCLAFKQSEVADDVFIDY
jgi:hypothetical protein